MQEIKNLLRAAYLIETDGVYAVNKTVTLVGKDVAIALIIAHIRRQILSSSENKYSPFDPQINVEITEILKKNNLIE